jgi:hypothetical protein
MSLAAGVLLVVSFAYAINAIADFRLKPQFADDPDVIKWAMRSWGVMRLADGPKGDEQ